MEQQRLLEIAGRPIGPGCPPFLIAEAGINHNGDFDLACRMIETAKAAGADAIKFQTFKAEEFVGDPNLTYTYQSQGKEVTESMLEMFRRVEFSREEWHGLKAKCDQTGIQFLSTPQNVSDLDLLLEIGLPAIKVGSDDFNNLPLLRQYAQQKLPLILSCGMADLAEVYQALETVGAFHGHPVILLLCTSQYPTPPEDVNLLKLKTLQSAFPFLITGLSDHTQGSLAASTAVGLGACVFEKHFTLDHDLPGPDHWFSADPVELGDWIGAIRTAHTMLGSSLVRPTPAELEMRILARRSVVATREIQPGEVLTEVNTGLRRPGNGLSPSLYPEIIGKKATRPLENGTLLQWGDFA